MAVRGTPLSVRHAATLAVAALLFGCQPQEPPVVTTAGAAPAAVADAAEGEGEAGPDPRLNAFAVPDPVEPWDEEEEAPVEEAAIPADIGADPARLQGLTPAVLQAALGPPSFRRRERNAEIWQYYGEGCILDLFLYEEGGRNRVAHVALRNRLPGEAAAPGCLGGIAAKARPRNG